MIRRKKAKILIAGLGSIGRRHLRNFRVLGYNEFGLYRTHRGTFPDDELEGLPVETDLEAVLHHKPQVAIISNPTTLHLPVAIEVAQARCHLFIEKSLSHTLEGVWI